MSDEPPATSLSAARTELKAAQGALATLQARQYAGELIPRKQFNDRAFAFLRGLRDRLQMMGARHAAILAARYGREPAEVAQLIERCMAAITAELAQAAIAEPLFERALRPDPIMSVSEWADQHRILSSRGASEAGPYRIKRTPYLKEIMDALSASSTVRRVVFKKGSQIGATEAGNCWLGYIIDHAPGPVIAVQPTVELAKRFSKQRIEPLIAESPRLRERVAPARERDSGNTTMMKEFAGGVLVMTGANSAVGLRSMPARYLFADEVDAYPADVGGEGDPLSLAEARTRTFSFRSKTFIVSTPSLKDLSVISREYQRSDQRRYFVPCPLCNHMQILDFERLHWEPGKPEGAQYRCAGCEESFAEQHKTVMLENGEWRPTAESTDPHVRGYQLSALYSPVGWLSWADIAKQSEEAVNDAEKRKTFVNTVLGEDWQEEADAVPDWQRLYERREDWPHHVVPERGLFLTAGADVQVDRIEVDVWAWGRQLESWLVEHRILYGDTKRAPVWEQLTAMIGETWEHAGGLRMGLQRLAIDTGAFTNEVYQWARVQPRELVLPIKGVPAYDRLVPVGGPTRVDVLQNGKRLKRGILLWTVSVSYFKKELYKHLNLDKPTDEELREGMSYQPGFVHLPRFVPDEWVKQLCAEQQVIVRSRRGFAIRTEWRQLRPRNEALDCRVYARAAVWLAGADRWAESKWRDLESQLGQSSPGPAEPPAIAGSIAARQVMVRRRMPGVQTWR